MWTKLFICFGLYVCVASGSKTYYGQAGESITLKCHDHASEVSWKYGSTTIISVDKSGRLTKGSSSFTERVVMSGTNLKIDDLKSEDKGTYTCIITDRKKGQTTSKMTLQVFKVSVSVNPASPLLPSSAATLTCDAEGSPKTVAWKHNNQDLTAETGTTVTLGSVEGSHGGTWQCLVDYGEKQIEASLNIDVIGLKEGGNVTVKQGKDALLPCSLSTPNLGILRVAGGGWKQLSPDDAPRLPSLNTSNDKELRWNSGDIDADKVTISKDKLQTDLGITLKKVQPSQAGQYQCSVEFKDRGTLTTTVNLEVTGGGKGGGSGSGKPSKGSPKGSPPSWRGLNMWIWVGVAVGSVVLIALIVAVALVHRSNRRRKMRMRKLRSVRKPLTANDYCQCNRPPRAVNLDRPVRVPRQQRPENIQTNGGYGGRPHN